MTYFSGNINQEYLKDIFFTDKGFASSEYGCFAIHFYFCPFVKLSLEKTLATAPSFQERSFHWPLIVVFKRASNEYRKTEIKAVMPLANIMMILANHKKRKYIGEPKRPQYTKQNCVKHGKTLLIKSRLVLVLYLIG